MPVERIIEHLPSLPHGPGVYRMTDANNKDLYIGKAKNLFKRVTSYTRLGQLSHRLRQMVHHVHTVRILVTETEADALILEAQLIKKHRPQYNILLKDRNAFSYIALSHHAFPQLYKKRTPSTTSSKTFGPFLSYASIQPIFDILQKRFQLRSCSDTVFAQRTRPCLQYYIKKCSAPCVGKISHDAYTHTVHSAMQLLQGKTKALITSLEHDMHCAANQHHYDKAHDIQKQVQSLRLLTSQKIPLQSDDIVVLASRDTVTCLHVQSFRNSTFYGSESFFFHNTSPQDHAAIVVSFLKNFYSKNQPPRRLALPMMPDQIDDVKTIAQHYFGYKPHCFVPKKGRMKKEMDTMYTQCQSALTQYVVNQKTALDDWGQLYAVLNLIPEHHRIEIYDNSHHQGSYALSAMVVVNQNTFSKNDYRVFSMDKGPDDYEMMRQVMVRRFNHPEWTMPDLIIVDGGKGQISAAQQALKSMNITVPLIGIAKSTPQDQIIDTQGRIIDLTMHRGVFFMIQKWRDEAHRFAVTNHRNKKTKGMVAPKK